MSWLYSLALVEEFSEGNYLDGALCVRLKKTRIARKHYLDGKKKGRFPRSQSGTTWKRLTVALGVGAWISSLVGSPAKTSRSRVKEPESMGKNLGFGGKWQELSVKYDRNTHGWKTHRLLFSEGLPWSSVTLPRWGMMHDGVLYQRKISARPIAVTGSGYLPTPRASSYGYDHGLAGQRRLSLNTMARKGMWPTPTVSDCKRGCESPESKIRRGSKTGITLNDAVGVSEKQLNPDWVEWLMGWPIGWTSMDDFNPAEFDRWRTHMDQGSGWDYEPDNIPRATTVKSNRIDRLKAIGNGQVPLAMAVAWNILTQNKHE